MVYELKFSANRFGKSINVDIHCYNDNTSFALELTHMSIDVHLAATSENHEILTLP